MEPNKDAQIKQFLDQIALYGLDDINSLPQFMNYDGAGKDIASSMLVYFCSGEQTLENFAHCLSSVYSVGLKKDELNNFLNHMNKGYFIQANVESFGIDNIIQELMFWDGCSINEAQIYFESLKERYLNLISNLDEFPDQVFELIDAVPHSNEMRKIQLKTHDIMRSKLIGSMALENEPEKQLKMLIKYAQGDKSSALIDDELWSTISNEILDQCSSGPSVYLNVRNTLLQYAQMQESESHFALLNRLNAMIVTLDAKLNWGTVFDSPKEILNYWRVKRFEGINDHALTMLYDSLIEIDPGQAKKASASDYEILKNKTRDQLLLGKLKRISEGNINSGIKKSSTKNSNAKKYKDFHLNKQNIFYIVAGSLLLIGIVYIATLTVGHLKANTNQPAPTPTVTPFEQPTKKPEQRENNTPEPVVEVTPEQEKESERPSETSKPTPTPEITPSPSPSPSPTPVPRTNEEEEPIEEEDDIIDLEPDYELDQEIPIDPDIPFEDIEIE